MEDEQVETNIFHVTEENKNEMADLIEVTTKMAQSIQKELNKKTDDNLAKEKFNSKVDKEEGKGLSEEDFTTILKQKLEELKNYDDSALRQILNGSIKDITLDVSNGHIIFHKNDGSTAFIDTALELIIESGIYDKSSKKIILTLANENVIEIPIGDLITDIYSKSEIDEILNNYEKKHTYYTEVVKEVISRETEVQTPCSYVVGNNEIDIFIDGIYLKCEKSENDIANYREVGEKGSTSDKVMFGFDLMVGEELTIIKKGAVEEDDNE